MRVRVSYTVEVDDDLRRAINDWYGRPGLATRDQVRAWYEANGSSMDEDLTYHWDRRSEEPEDDAGQPPADFLELVDAAKCAPDSRHLSGGGSYQWLADRYHRETGHTISAVEVERMENEFWEQSRARPGITIGTMRLEDF